MMYIPVQLMNGLWSRVTYCMSHILCKSFFNILSKFYDSLINYNYLTITFGFCSEVQETGFKKSGSLI